MLKLTNHVIFPYNLIYFYDKSNNFFTNEICKTILVIIIDFYCLGFNFWFLQVPTTSKGVEELQIESFIYQSKGHTSKIVGSTIDRRKHWMEHRKSLQRSMRDKRMEQYEARILTNGFPSEPENDKNIESNSSDNVRFIF